jgi:hypothetical protein
MKFRKRDGIAFQQSRLSALQSWPSSEEALCIRVHPRLVHSTDVERDGSSSKATAWRCFPLSRFVSNKFAIANRKIAQIRSSGSILPGDPPPESVSSKTTTIFFRHKRISRCRPFFAETNLAVLPVAWNLKPQIEMPRVRNV